MRAKLNTPPRVKIFYRQPEDDSGNPPVVPRLPARAGRGGRRERRPLAPSSLRAGARVGRVKRARGLRYRRSNRGGRSSAAQPAHQPFPVPGRQPRPGRPRGLTRTGDLGGEAPRLLLCTPSTTGEGWPAPWASRAQLWQPCPLPASRAAPGPLAGAARSGKGLDPECALPAGPGASRCPQPAPFSSRTQSTALHRLPGGKLTSFQPKRHAEEAVEGARAACSAVWRFVGSLWHRRIPVPQSCGQTAFCSARHEEDTQRKTVSAADSSQMSGAKRAASLGAPAAQEKVLQVGSSLSVGASDLCTILL